MAREWQYYTAPGGGEPVLKDIKKSLTRNEQVRLQALMDRYLEDRLLPKDYKYLRDDISELRLTGNDNRKFRLYFAHLNDGAPVLLALHFASKKKWVDKEAIDLAVTRLREWRKNPQ